MACVHSAAHREAPNEEASKGEASNGDQQESLTQAPACKACGESVAGSVGGRERLDCEGGGGGLMLSLQERRANMLCPNPTISFYSLSVLTLGSGARGIHSANINAQCTINHSRGGRVPSMSTTETCSLQKVSSGTLEATLSTGERAREPRRIFSGEPRRTRPALRPRRNALAPPKPK